MSENTSENDNEDLDQEERQGQTQSEKQDQESETMELDEERMFGPEDENVPKEIKEKVEGLGMGKPNAYYQVSEEEYEKMKKYIPENLQKTIADSKVKNGVAPQCWLPFFNVAALCASLIPGLGAIVGLTTLYGNLKILPMWPKKKVENSIGYNITGNKPERTKNSPSAFGSKDNNQKQSFGSKDNNNNSGKQPFGSKKENNGKQYFGSKDNNTGQTFGSKRASSSPSFFGSKDNNQKQSFGSKDNNNNSGKQPFGFKKENNGKQYFGSKDNNTGQTFGSKKASSSPSFFGSKDNNQKQPFGSKDDVGNSKKQSFGSKSKDNEKQDLDPKDNNVGQPFGSKGIDKPSNPFSEATTKEGSAVNFGTADSSNSVLDSLKKVNQTFGTGKSSSSPASYTEKLEELKKTVKKPPKVDTPPH